ncbi:MAG: peptidase, partial [Microvirga sp.]|nr:peptidase [Microvirga sp.]
MAEQTASLPMLTRADTARFVPRTINEAERTIEVTWTTGDRVRRRGFFSDAQWDEELDLADESVNLARLNGGAPLLDSHSAYRLGSIMGVVESAWLQGPKGRREGRAKVRFSAKPEAETVWGEVKAGIIRNISVGYSVDEWVKQERKEDVPLMRAVRWTPLEISLVAVPADAAAQVRSAADEFPCVVRCIEENRSMADNASGTAQEAAGTSQQTPPPAPQPEPQPAPPPAPAPEPAAPPPASNGDGDDEKKEGERRMPTAHQGLTTAECAQITRSAGSLGVSAEEAAAIMGKKDMTLARALAEIIDKNAKRQEDTQVTNVQVRGLTDEADNRSAGMANAILYQSNPAAFPLTDLGRKWIGRKPMELARAALEGAGIRTEGMSPNDVATQALLPGFGGHFGVRIGGLHTTSDFAGTLANVTQQTLRRAYDAMPRTFTSWARRTTAQNFKPIAAVQVGGAPKLWKVNEHGEFPRGTLYEGKETYRIFTRGVVVGITRQLMINDDLNAMTRIPGMFGASAANAENDVVYALLLANGALSDGTALFHANHANLAGTAGAPSVATLGAARTALFKQTDPDGNPIGVMPRYTLIPPSLEVTVAQLMAPITPALVASTVPDILKSTTWVMEPRLETGVTLDGVTYAGSATAWYQVADPATVDTIEYAYLSGNEGVYTETRNGFDVDGVEFKCRI